MDLKCPNEDIYAIGWSLATIVEFYFNNEKHSKPTHEIDLKIILSHNIKTFEHLQELHYARTRQLLTRLTT